jgi:hypothetical protein
MKNNVLNTLLIAFFLIGGWTLFTIWQDLRNTDGLMNSGTLISRGKDYLPILPRMGSETISLPVYKGPGTTISSGRIKQQNIRYGSNGQIFGSSAFDISQSTAQGNFGIFSESGSVTGASGRRSGQLSNQTSVAPFSINAPRGLFSRNNTRGLLAKEETDGNYQSQGSISGSSLASGGGGPMKVFGEGEGDPLEGGGGNENLNEYNDNPEVPVGGGLVVLMAFAGMYALFRKRRIF